MQCQEPLGQDTGREETAGWDRCDPQEVACSWLPDQAAFAASAQRYHLGVVHTLRALCQHLLRFLVEARRLVAVGAYYHMDVLGLQPVPTEGLQCILLVGSNQSAMYL